MENKILIIALYFRKFSGDLVNQVQSTLVTATSLITINHLSRWKSSGAISPLFHNIFNISLTSGVKLHIHLWNVVVQFIFSSICKSDMLRYGYLKVLQRFPWSSYTSDTIRIFSPSPPHVESTLNRLCFNVVCLLDTRFHVWPAKSPRCPHEDALYPWPSLECPAKMLIRHRGCAG